MCKFVVEKSLSDALGKIPNFEVYQFIAFVYSSWHLDNLLACMKLDNLTHGLIFLMPLNRKRFPEYYFSHPLFDNCVCYQLETQTSTFSYQNFKRFLCCLNKKRIKVYNPMGVNIRTLSMLPLHRYKVDYCVIDEGTGTYVGRSFENCENRRILLLKAEIFQFVKSIICFFFRIKVRDNVLFKKNKRFMLNQRLLGVLKEVYTEFANLPSNTDQILFNQLDKDFILFYKDYGIDDESLYRQLFSHLSLNFHKVYIKMHPLEVNEKFCALVREYGFEIIPPLVSGEQIASLKPFFIVGGTSTAIFTSSAVFDNTVFSILDIYKKMGIQSMELEPFEYLRQKIGVLIPNLKFVSNFFEIA